MHLLNLPELALIFRVKRRGSNTNDVMKTQSDTVSDRVVMCG